MYPSPTQVQYHLYRYDMNAQVLSQKNCTQGARQKCGSSLIVSFKYLLNMLFDFPALKTWPWPLEKQALGSGWCQYFWGPNTCVQVDFTCRWGRADGEGAEANPGTGGEAEEGGQC